jgi:hypothetical protein
MFEHFNKGTCPIDKKRCDAEIHRYARNHEYSDGIDYGICRYGSFGEVGDGGSNYVAPNCELKHPRTKREIADIERSEITDLRLHGFHDIANKKTIIVKPKTDILLPQKRRYSDGDFYDVNPKQYGKEFLFGGREGEEDLRKKKTTSKPKRKPIKKIIKKCSCKKK